MSWIEAGALCVHLAVSAQDCRGEERRGRGDRAPPQPAALKPRNKRKLSFNTQEISTLAKRHGRTRGATHSVADLGDTTGSFVDATRDDWKLRTKENNNTGKKTGITRSTDNKTLPDKWSAWCRGSSPSRKTG